MPAIRQALIRSICYRPVGARSPFFSLICSFLPLPLPIIIIIRHQLVLLRLLLDLFRVASRGNMSTSKTAKLANNFRVRNEKEKAKFSWGSASSIENQRTNTRASTHTHRHTPCAHTHLFGVVKFNKSRTVGCN